MDIEKSELVEKGYRGGNMTLQPIVEEIQNAQILDTSKNIWNVFSCYLKDTMLSDCGDFLETEGSNC